MPSPSSDDSVDPSTAFSALGDPTRIDILQALAEHHRDRPENPILSFSELRKRVGVRDSGRFLYHLDELRDQFVEKVEAGSENDGDEGYRLTYSGTEVAAAILAGTYTDRRTIGPAELDSECVECGAPAIARYDDGTLWVACENDHPLFAWGLPPNAAADASIEEVIDLATLLAGQATELALAGTCSQCYDPVEPRVAVVGADAGPDADDADANPDAEDPRRIRFRARCGTCGATLDAPIGYVLLDHPEVAALYHRHGRSLREIPLWELPFVQDDAAVDLLDDDPPRVRFDVRVEDERLAVTVDETARVERTDLEAISGR